jgi:hypothetical protein
MITTMTMIMYISVPKVTVKIVTLSITTEIKKGPIRRIIYTNKIYA